MSVLNILQNDSDKYVNSIKQSVLTTNNMSASDIITAIEARNEAKLNKDWATADLIRDNLRKKGIILKDTVAGTVWDVEL